MRESTQRLKQVWAKSAAYRGSTTLRSLARLSTSTSSDRRLLGVMLMRRELGRRGLVKGYWRIAVPLVADPDNDCRWQALIVLGEFVEVHPDAVWNVVAQYGSSSDSDMRTGIACVLLEHLLEHHFAEYFPAVRRRVVAGDSRFVHTLSECWVSGRSGRRQRIARLLASARRSPRSRRGSLANKRLNPPQDLPSIK
jgi:hypothetical protein